MSFNYYIVKRKQILTLKFLMGKGFDLTSPCHSVSQTKTFLCEEMWPYLQMLSRFEVSEKRFPSQGPTEQVRRTLCFI